MKLKFVAMPRAVADAFRNGAKDANGNAPLRSTSDGSGNPCRCCLCDIPKHAPMLVLAWKSLASDGPWAETGPVFLCAETCAQHHDEVGMPPITRTRDRYLVRGYDRKDRIAYGSGRLIPTGEMEAYAAQLLQDPDLKAVHVRSQGYSCYQFRIERG